MGALVSPNELVVGWELPAVVGVDFVVDPFDDTCKFTFTQEIAFLFKSTRKIAMIKCDVKLEFPVREVSEIRQFTSWSSLVVVLRLSSSLDDDDDGRRRGTERLRMSRTAAMRMIGEVGS
ncbi:hypothetical protein Syun_016932 [Stephania yunnanensis]|uniref:RNA-dependent RNA polymerase 6-like second domain-containing protein n=1 Tax=Stephania yunnanensis TaxID=152371 RepID=A0AAP0J6X9_9MAGN